MFSSHRPVRLIVLSVLLALLSACGAAPVAPSDTAPAVAATTAVPAAPTEASTPTTAETAMPVSATTLTVFAAASLTDAFGELGKAFEAEHSGVTVAFNFAGSNQLAQQITQGAPADVFAPANTTQMNVVIDSGEIITGTQQTFVLNRLVVIYPGDNPAGLQTLHDLARPGLKLVLAAREVPVGLYALDFLGKASKLPEYTAAFSETVAANVVSYEANVRAVLSKVALGEADAGIVYTSDVAGEAASAVGRLDIPDELNTIARYPIAPIKDAPNTELAQDFVNYMLTPAAQTILGKYGFIPAVGNGGDG